jgi:hypothetical protein
MIVPSQPLEAILRFKWIALTAGSIATFALFLVRLTSVVKDYQYTLAGGGGEAAAVFGVYQACIGKQIYHDFSASLNSFLYNFLFYQLYGVLSHWVVGCNIDILLFGRMVTCTALVGTAAAFILPQNDHLTPSENLFLFSLSFAPLIGWWAFAIRPDVIGMMFLTLALIVFRWGLVNGTKYIVLSAVLIFLAWACKQPFIVLAPVMFVFAIWYCLQGGLLFAAVVGVLLAGVFVGPGFDNYVLHTITIPSLHQIFIRTMVGNFEQFGLKAGPVLLVALSIFIVKFRNGRIDRVDVFDAAALLFSGVTSFIAAGKAGASDNYYFPVYAIAILIGARGIPQLVPRVRACVLAFGGFGLLAVSLVYLTGAAGRMTLLDVNRAQVREVEDFLAAAPRPKLVIHDLFALPWFSGDPEQSVFESDFEVSIPSSMSLEHEIVNGLYATIAAPNTFTQNFDLHHYRMDKSINGFQIWIRLKR